MKTCSTCHQNKDESEFYTDKSQPTGLTYNCKQCRQEINKHTPSHNREYWRQKSRKAWARNPEQQLAYAKTSRERLKNDPLRHALKLAKERELYHRYKAALGIPSGTKEEYHARRRHKHKLRQDEINSRFQDRLAFIYGQPFLNAYLKSPFNAQTKETRPHLEALKKSFISSHTSIPVVPDALVRRVCDLNRVANLPLMNIGWHCLSCGLFHFHPALFEIDHIIPRSHGGNDTVSNKQILCPTCHKKKTLGILNVQVNQSFRNPNNLQLCFA